MSRLCVREKENMGLVRWVQGAGAGSGPQLTARPFGHRKYTPIPSAETAAEAEGNHAPPPQQQQQGQARAKAGEGGRGGGSGELHGAVKDLTTLRAPITGYE